MSDSTARLRHKIHSATELQSVVRTMKALASSNIGQYQRSVAALADYNRTVEFGLGVCLRRATVAGNFKLPATGATQAPWLNAVVFGSDQGLVGRFNDRVADHAVQALGSMPGKPRVWAVGERVHGRLVDVGLPVAGVLPVPGSVRAIAALVGHILVEVERHDPDGTEQMHLFHNRPDALAVYAPHSSQLLPLDSRWSLELSGLPWPTRYPPEILGGDADTLRALIREYVFVSLFRACAESLASENASRLAAMERAERNIDELLEQLNGCFFRLRQSGIDEELFDVVAGFEALTRTYRAV